MALWRLVREARKRAGLSQWALSQRAGVAQSTVARIESGARCPSTDMVERLVRAAGFEIRVALGEPDPQTTSVLERNLQRTPAELGGRCSGDAVRAERSRDAPDIGRWLMCVSILGRALRSRPVSI